MANVSTTHDNFLEENNYVCGIEGPLWYLTFTMGKFASTKLSLIRIHNSINF